MCVYLKNATFNGDFRGRYTSRGWMGKKKKWVVKGYPMKGNRFTGVEKRGYFMKRGKKKHDITSKKWGALMKRKGGGASSRRG